MVPIVLQQLQNLVKMMEVSRQVGCGFGAKIKFVIFHCEFLLHFNWAGVFVSLFLCFFSFRDQISHVCSGVLFLLTRYVTIGIFAKIYWSWRYSFKIKKKVLEILHSSSPRIIFLADIILSIFVRLPSIWRILWGEMANLNKWFSLIMFLFTMT